VPGLVGVRLDRRGHAVQRAQRLARRLAAVRAVRRRARLVDVELGERVERRADRVDPRGMRVDDLAR
jgi:hypothetical protein